MRGLLIGTGISVFFGVAGSCLAAPPMSQGVIRFNGSVVETPCRASETASPCGLELGQCPKAARGNVISVNPVATVSGLNRSGVKVKLLADSGTAEPYYQQRYVLVDTAGRPVTSGNYLVTLSLP